ncbi:Uncharacterized protein TCM_031339 [Theobroma cacao]|uniref:Uncharacterized protein n=1 Tax=Theobroma cacao TaxID=3641 RepID=A0A061F6Z9_THECC|nr:Uncharacterized protein TCM_031339 [Theobroma cacao]
MWCGKAMEIYRQNYNGNISIKLMISCQPDHEFAVALICVLKTTTSILCLGYIKERIESGGRRGGHHFLIFNYYYY